MILLLTTLEACTTGTVEKSLPDSLASPATHLNKGITKYNNDNYPDAIKHFEKALLLYRSIDNQAGIAQSCMNLAKSYMAVNDNQIAAQYLKKADEVLRQTPIKELDEHLHLLNSSLAIKNVRYQQALTYLEPVLNSTNTAIQLAAYKNRCTIAFAENDNDKQQWLGQYKKAQQKNPESTKSHLARILRFESELANDNDTRKELLTQSLTISQELADRTAIAATLAQWSQLDINSQRYNKAEDKALRALFIRHQLGDVKNTLIILKQLQQIYAVIDINKHEHSSQWIEKLGNNDFADWNLLYADFETYPAH